MPFDPLKFTGSNNGASVAASNSATISLPVKIGDLVIAVFGEQTALTATTCSDNLSNIYQAFNVGVDSGTSTVRAYWSIVATAGTLVAVSVAATASGDDFALAVACFQGPFTGTVDKNPANASDIASPFAGPATGTLTQKDELIISYFGTSGNATWSATAPLLKAIQVSSSTNITVGIGYQLVNATTTITPGWTGTNPTDDSFGTATFTLDTTPTRFQKIEWMGDVPAFFAREYPLSLRSWISQPQSPFPPYTAATYMPSRVRDWGTVPAASTAPALTWTQRPQLTAVVAGPLPENQYDWPVPATPDYSVSLRTFIAINPPLLATSPPPPILMPPLIVEWGISDRTTFEPARIQYNAPLLSAAPIQPPFNQDDWPVPSAQRQPDRTFQRAFPPTLVGQDRLPIRQQIWPVPIAPDFSVSLRSFLARPGLPLITAPVLPPFSQDDWPLPIAAVQPIRTWTQSPTIATPVVAPTFMPSRVSEWGMWESVPFTPAPIANLTLSLPVAVAVTYVFREPYYSSQWAGPRFETWTTTVNLALRAGPPPQRPFTQTDWPLTPAARQPDRTYQRAFPPELVGQDKLPIRQKDWPLTNAPYYDSSLRTQAQRSILATPAALPFNQQSWPLTPATEFSNALRSIGFRSPALDVVAGRPFVQTDWPVPVATRQPDRTFQRSFPPALVGKDRLPIRQQDWPLPIAPRPAADLRTYIAQSPIRLIGKDRLPFNQKDWPVPRAPLEFHTLRSITQNRVIYGGEVAPIPPEPPLPPPEVIHSVRAHADAYYGVFYADEIKGRADFSRAKGLNDEEAAN